MRNLVFIFIILCSFVQCKTLKKAPVDSKNELKRLIQNHEDNINAFVGFNIVDAESGAILYDQNSKKLFTPASNIKLYTYWLSTQILNNNEPSFYYLIQNDSLIIKPNADPLFLNYSLDSIQSSVAFLKSQKQKICILKTDTVLRYGTGWAWDDYAYSYQIAKNSMPVYGNQIKIYNNDSIAKIQTEPPYLSNFIQYKTLTKGFITKEELSNIIFIDTLKSPKEFEQSIPLTIHDSLLKNILSQELQKDVSFISQQSFKNTFLKSPNTNMDTIYKNLLFKSDNFIAEQLLLMCSQKVLNKMNVNSILSWAHDSIVPDEMKNIRWVDGSGLSRYNLISPKSTITVLQHLYERIGIEKLKTLLPYGHEEDTLDTIFFKNEKWIFAKTGTLSNNFNLSGYLISDKGKVYIFSFLNNHYNCSKKDVVNSMHSILSHIKSNY